MRSFEIHYSDKWNRLTQLGTTGAFVNLFQCMQVFVAVAENGTFSGAAQQLKMSAPSVTRIIAQLEAHLQVQLFQRTTRHVSLTPAGEDYARDVQHILDTVDMAHATLQGDASKTRGTLRIGCQQSLAEYWIAPLYPAFRESYPDIDLDVHVETAPLLNLSSYDVALVVMRDGADSSIVARRLFTSDGILCASPGYLAKFGTPTTPEDLPAHQCLLRQSNETHSGRLQLWRRSAVLKPRPDHEGRLRPSFTINHTGSLLQMALEGAGIAAFSTDVVHGHIEQGRLVHVMPDWITGRFVVLAAVPSQRYLPTRTQVFLKMLSKYGQRMS